MKEIKKEKPILFSTEMVKAILSGSKTMTRRAIKPRHEGGMFTVSSASYEPDMVGYYHNRCVTAINDEESTIGDVLCPYGEVGDILWVRESWRYVGGGFVGKPDTTVMSTSDFVYKADEEWNGPFKPSIHMPRAACRIRLEITDIKVERLQDISEEDAKAEGAEGMHCTYTDGSNQGYTSWREGFAAIWRKINGEESWNQSPWVWVITFKSCPCSPKK